ncbi:MAG: hypothetical protein AB7U82_28350 [Blastocatellales bacterium]
MRSTLYRSFVLFVTVISLALVIENESIVSGQGNSTVPSPPSQVADRVGVYAWGFESSAYQSQTGGSIDRLNWGADKVAEVGSRTIRLTLPGVVYGLPDSSDLAQTAASPAYDKLFSDPRFKTYMLTVTTTGAFIDTEYAWSDGYTQAEYDATRAEIGKLGDYLLANPKYAGKNFIILNWEADNEIILYSEKQTIWDAFTAWIQSRADGVKDARNRNPNSAAKLYSGFEFNLVKSRAGAPCGTPVADPIRENPLKNRCAVDYIAPRVDVDYYSYSSWQTVNERFDAPNVGFKDALKRDLSFALARIREKRPEVQEQNFIIGEFGIIRMQWGEKTVANLVSEMIDAVTAPDGFQVSYAVWWQIIDNLPFNLVWTEGFGLFTSRHGIFHLNLVGDTFKKRLAGQPHTPLAGGPMIRRSPAGIVNAATGEPDPQLNPNSRVNVFAGAGEQFTADGNRINIEQMINHFLITRDNTPDFAESAAQLSATLPRGLRPGPAFIQVYDGAGVESQGQYVVFNCAPCPVINEIIDSEKQLGEFHPSAMVTITGGNFLPSGNTVIVEQQDVLSKKYRFVVPAADVLEERADLIRVRLPRDLVFTKFTFVVVATQSGLESNVYPLRQWPYQGITPECPPCAPAISIKSGVVNRDNGSLDFPPGSVVTISGDRFSASGNTVIVEQGTARYVVQKDADWNESPTRITATLPGALKAGRAQIYVVNAQGRESKVAEITVARGVPRIRRPINRGQPRQVEQSLQQVLQRKIRRGIE